MNKKITILNTTIYGNCVLGQKKIIAVLEALELPVNHLDICELDISVRATIRNKKEVK